MENTEIKITYSSFNPEALPIDDPILTLNPLPTGRLLMKYKQDDKQYGKIFYLSKKPDDAVFVSALRVFLQEVSVVIENKEEE